MFPASSQQSLECLCKEERYLWERNFSCYIFFENISESIFYSLLLLLLLLATKLISGLSKEGFPNLTGSSAWKLGRIWLQAEYRPERMTASANYLNPLSLESSVESGYEEGSLTCTKASTREFSEQQPQLTFIVTYLNVLLAAHLNSETHCKTQCILKKATVWRGSIIHWVCGSLKLICRSTKAVRF